MPKMAELHEIDVSKFTPSLVDANKLEYLDPQRKRQREATWAARREGKGQKSAKF